MIVTPIPPSTQGALVWLTAGKVRVSVLAAAFAALGYGKLLPRREKRAIALRAALVETCRAYLGRRRKLRIFPLDRRVLGFDVREHQPGVEKSELPYVLTAKADDRHAWITHDGLPGDPQMSRHLSDRYLERCNYFCPTTTGALVKRVLEEKLHATSVRGNGGLWFLPGAFIPQYRALAAALEQSHANPDSDCVFSIGTFQLADNPEVARDAVAAVIADAKALAAEINGDLLGTGDDSVEMTNAGKENRKQRLATLRARVQGYAEMFGVGLGEIDQLLAGVESALALQDLADMSA
jgi:hypothetical protein